jgi:hypothetical protein
VLGPLPPLYRWVVCTLALLVCVGLGAWLGWSLPVPVLAPTGALVGAALGVVIIGVLLHDTQPPPERLRSRRPRPRG